MIYFMCVGGVSGDASPKIRGYFNIFAWCIKSIRCIKKSSIKKNNKQKVEHIKMGGCLYRGEEEVLVLLNMHLGW